MLSTTTRSCSSPLSSAARPSTARSPVPPSRRAERLQARQRLVRVESSRSTSGSGRRCGSGRLVVARRSRRASEREASSSASGFAVRCDVGRGGDRLGQFGDPLLERRERGRVLLGARSDVLDTRLRRQDRRRASGELVDTGGELVEAVCELPDRVADERVLGRSARDLVEAGGELVDRGSDGSRAVASTTGRSASSSMRGDQGTEQFGIPGRTLRERRDARGQLVECGRWSGSGRDGGCERSSSARTAMTGMPRRPRRALGQLVARRLADLRRRAVGLSSSANSLGQRRRARPVELRTLGERRQLLLERTHPRRPPRRRRAVARTVPAPPPAGSRPPTVGPQTPRPGRSRAASAVGSELWPLREPGELLLERAHTRGDLDVSGGSLGQLSHGRLESLVDQRARGQLVDPGRQGLERRRLLLERPDPCRDLDVAGRSLRELANRSVQALVDERPRG